MKKTQAIKERLRNRRRLGHAGDLRRTTRTCRDPRHQPPLLLRRRMARNRPAPIRKT